MQVLNTNNTVKTEVNTNIKPPCPAGFEEFIVEVNGIELVCHIDYEPEEFGSRENGLQMEPDYPASITLCGVYAGSLVDIQELLSEDIIDEITAHIAHEISSMQGGYDAYDY